MRTRKEKLETDNEELFIKWRDLGDEEQGIIENIKIVARKRSEEGKTVYLHDDDRLQIFVSAQPPPDEYDYTGLLDTLTPDQMLLLLPERVDPKMVEQAITDGLIKEKYVKKFKSKGEAKTPAVFVKWSDG